MGLVIQETKWGATNHPTPAPMPTAMSEWMMRLRSSTRCSKKVICPPDSRSGGTGGMMEASGGLLVMGKVDVDGWIGILRRICRDVAGHSVRNCFAGCPAIRFGEFRRVFCNRGGAGHGLRHRCDY